MTDEAARHIGPDCSVADIQAALLAGELTSRALVAQCLARIDAIDRSGPKINAVIETNPDALSIAEQRDAERHAGVVRGPLHGIPVLLKDNIATADRMRTSAGSLALANTSAVRDAHLVTRLRDAGAIILGKTNLSEWANFRASRSLSGWSARGGLTLNPYALDRNPSGSSAGSGAAVAAGLAPLAVGTETDGSIVSPASICGLVGIKPTVGLISRAGVIPISASQDTAGPMCRTVADAAALLTVMAGHDAEDAATTAGPRLLIDYSWALNRHAIDGARIGVIRKFFGRNELVGAVIDAAIEQLRALGAVIIDPVEIPNTNKYRRSGFEVLLYEFKAGLNAWLRDYAPGAPVATLADVIAFNVVNAEVELAHFGQDTLINAQSKAGLAANEYLEARANNIRFSRAEGLDRALAENQLDALIAPTGGVAAMNDFINGDYWTGSFSSPAAVAGYPHITVPAGFVRGLPVGLSFVGAAWSESRLLSLAYAFEQATLHRRAPTFAPTLLGIR